MFRGLFHYVDKNSFIHRIDPRVKLFLLVPILLLAIASNGVVTLLFVFSFVIMLYVLARIPRYRYKAILIVCLLSSISFFFFGSFFYFGFYHYPESSITIWLWIFRPEQAESLPIIGPIILSLTQGRGIVLCKEGFIWGTVTALKFLIALFSSNLMIMTTKPKEILLALNKLGVPIKLTFVAMTALRFVPVVMEEWYVTLNAQQARGLKIKKLDIKGVLSTLTTTLSTLIVNSIRRARILALAMETRAFGANVKKVSYHELKMTRLDAALTIAIAVATVFIMVLILLFPYHTGYTL
jgi:energy-coupling factor transport system permease protein